MNLLGQKKGYKLKTWDDIKKEYRAKTTEDMFGINNPPVHQCSKIDDICTNVSNIYSETQFTAHENYEDVELVMSKFYEIEYCSRDLESTVNEVRDTIEEVRVWGQDWKDLAKRIILKHNIDIADIE